MPNRKPGRERRSREAGDCPASEPTGRPVYPAAHRYGAMSWRSRSKAPLPARRYCQRHRVVRTPTPTLARRTPVKVNDSKPVVPDAGNVIIRAATSPRTLPTSASARSRNSQTMNPRQPLCPGHGSTSASSARTSIVDSFGSVHDSWALMVKVLPATAALAYAAGESCAGNA